jgi:hypothetical protein
MTLRLRSQRPLRELTWPEKVLPETRIEIDDDAEKLSASAVPMRGATPSAATAAISTALGLLILAIQPPAV